MRSYLRFPYLYTDKNNKHITNNIMAKGKDAKKNVKKAALKTAKEKKAEKREKKAKRD